MKTALACPLRFLEVTQKNKRQNHKVHFQRSKETVKYQEIGGRAAKNSETGCGGWERGGHELGKAATQPHGCRNVLLEGEGPAGGNGQAPRNRASPVRGPTNVPQGGCRKQRREALSP